MSNVTTTGGRTTGIKGVDHAHSKLFRAMEALCDSFDHGAPARDTSDLFAMLHAEASANFALEERIMREREYPSYAAHKADHERLLERIRFMMEAYDAGKCADCGTSLRACVTDWFDGHFKKADSGLRDLAE